MKKIKQIGWGMLIIPLLLITCGKEAFQIRNTVSAKINGTAWSKDSLVVHGTYRHNPHKGVTRISIRSYLALQVGPPERTDYLEILSFTRVDLNSLEKQSIEVLSVGEDKDSTTKLTAKYFLAEYDLQLRDYEVLEMPGIDNWIQLDKIGKNTISGRFEVAFRVTRGATNWIPVNRPDTLYFTEGRFDLVPYPE